MPRKPRKQRDRAFGITEADYMYFTAGEFFEAEHYADGKTEEELKKFWRTHRAAIMDRYMARAKSKKWIADRPVAFWQYDMPEPQREIPPGEYDSLKTWDHQRHEYGWVESDYEYLNRLGLLEPWEVCQ